MSLLTVLLPSGLVLLVAYLLLELAFTLRRPFVGTVPT